MSFNWLEYLELAKALYTSPSNPGPEEACLRTAISRAYYAVFNIARAYAYSDHLQVGEGTGSHQAVIEHFKSSADSNKRRIGISLERLRTSRNKADYDRVLNNSLREAEKTIRGTEKLIKQLSNLPS